MNFPSGFSLDPKRGAGRVALSVVALMALVMIPAAAVTHLTGEYIFTATHDPLAISASNTTKRAGSNGIQGTSDVGIGIVGVGAVDGVHGQISANSTVYQAAGVLGTDSGSTGNQAGVWGESTATGSSAANNVGVLATGNNFGTAMLAVSGSGPAVVASGNTSHGGFGVVGAGTGEGGIFYGYPNVVGDGLSHPAIVAHEGYPGEDLIATYSVDPGGSGAQPETFIVQAGSQNRSGDALPLGTDVQVSGDLYVYGRVYSDCDAFPTSATTPCFGLQDAVETTSTGAKVNTYGPQQSMKTLEDFGEAQVVGGHAYVPLDHTFASSIAHDRSYLVFITPEGDSKGLYVTGKSTDGFAVRESMGGSSTLAFQYRIVAHPYGDTTTRMAVVAQKNRRATAFASRANDPTLLRSKLLTPAMLRSTAR